MLFTVKAQYIGQSEFIVEADNAQAAEAMFDVHMSTHDGSRDALLKIISECPPDSCIYSTDVIEARMPQPFLQADDIA